MVDIIIPLGIGSKSDNDELRLFLRSLEKNGLGYRNIIIVANGTVDWLQNVTVLQLDDPLQHNKDGNIIRKVLHALRKVEDISPEFVWTCDDCVVLKEFDFNSIPPIYNVRGKDEFFMGGNNWHKRLIRTFEYFEEKGFPLKHNYEAHVPQRFPTQKVLDVMFGIDYQSDVGYGINTLFFGLLKENGGFDQRLFKNTVENNDNKNPLLDKPLLGYNDKGFSVLKDKLFKMFPYKSKYEK